MTAPVYSVRGELIQTAERILRKSKVDAGHCRRVRHHAEVIFAAVYQDWIATDAQGAESALTRLILAGLLHDIGHFVADINHHRHSRYLLRHGQATQAWDDDLREDVATLAFSHRKKAKRAWRNRRFDGDTRLAQLAAILRIADGLDRSHQPGVTITCEVSAGVCTVAAQGLSVDDAHYLRTHKADLWPLVFDYELVLITRNNE